MARLANMLMQGGPGAYLSGANRLAPLLAQSDPNNGTVAGGLASIAQKLFQGYMYGRDRKQANEAGDAVTRGMTAEPWTNPDTGDQTIARDPPPSVGGSASMVGNGFEFGQGKPQMVPTAAAGGVDGALAALRGLSDNPYAGRYSQMLTLGKLDSETDAKAARDKAMLEDQLARSRMAYEWDNEPQTVSPGSAVFRGGQQIASVPAAPKAPRTVTTAQGVFLQNDDGSLGQRLGDPASQAGQGGGPFRGTGMDAQAINILLEGDPSSPEYRAAHAYMAAAKQTYDPATGAVATIRPDMSAFRPPVGQPQGAPGMAPGGVPGSGGSPTPMMPPQGASALAGEAPGNQPFGTAPGMPQQGPQGPQPMPQPMGPQTMGPQAAAPPMSPAGGVTVSEVPGAPRRFNDTQLKAAGFARRMQEAEAKMAEVTAQYPDFAPGNFQDNIIGDAPIVGNYARSEPGQMYRQAQEDWVTANLRPESGAVISPAEMEQEIRKYFPQPGDGPGVIGNKRRSRMAAAQNVAGQSSGAYEANNPQAGAPVRIQSDADYDMLPSGATFLAPDGTTRRKP